MVKFTRPGSILHPAKKWTQKLCTTGKTLLLLLSVIMYSTTFAQVDFRQSANKDAGFKEGDVHWLNSILQQSNSLYVEGMSSLQRVILLNVPTTAGDNHKITFSHQSIKKSAGAHAYDFLTSWDQAKTVANLIGQISFQPDKVLFGDLRECGSEPGSDPTGYLSACAAVHAGGIFKDVEAPNMSSPSPSPGTGSVQDKINAYETKFGNRTIRIWGDAAISNEKLDFNGYSGSDQDANYTLSWTSKSKTIVIEFATHLAVGRDPFKAGIGYGAGAGAGRIPGGPYHVNLYQLDGASLGSQDNQIKAADVLIPPDCTVSGPPIFCAEDGQKTYTSLVNEGGTNPAYAWKFIPDPNQVNAEFFNNTNLTANATIQPVGGPAAGDYKAGTFNLFLTVTTSAGLTAECQLEKDVIIQQVLADGKITGDGGADDLDGTANDVFNFKVAKIKEVDMTATGSGGTGSYTFKWEELAPFNGDDISFTFDAATGNAKFTINSITGLQTSYDFKVTVTDKNTANCVGTDIVTLVPDAALPPCDIDGPSPICPGSTNTYIYDPGLDGKGTADPLPADFKAVWTLVNNTNNATLQAPTEDVNSVKVVSSTACKTAYTVRLTLTSTSGLLKQVCEKTVSVSETEAPTISCPADKEISCTETPVFGTPTAKDNCDPDPKVVQVGDDVKTPGSCPQEYKLTRTWKAVDACGNESAPCSQTITVVDNEKPTIECKADKFLECGAEVVFDDPTAKDNCDPAPKIEVVSTTVSPDGLVHTRTWKAVDACGNESATCSQTITVGACAHIFPTQTTCCNYITQTATQLQNLCYTVKSGKVSNAIPGVMFYYADFTLAADAATLKIEVRQSQNGNFNQLDPQNASNVRLFTGLCGSTAISESDIVISGGQVTINAKNLAKGKYVVSVKYEVKAMIGSPAGGKPTVEYKFETLLNGVLAAGSTGRINAKADCTDNTPLPGNCTLPTVTSRDNIRPVQETLAPLSVSAVPNPYNDKVRFTFTSPESGEGSLEVFNMLGQKVSTVYKGYLQAGRPQQVEFKVPPINRENLIYILRVGKQQATGKLINRR
jgi:hypothetical protein